MTLKPALTGRARTIGYLSHAAQVRIDERVKEILARRVITGTGAPVTTTPTTIRGARG